MTLIQNIRNVLAISTATFSLVACQNEVDMPQQDSNEESTLVGIYPNSEDFLRNNPQSRSSNSFETNWENYGTVTLNSGITVELPWYETSSYFFESSFAEDIKKEDGWMMLMHTFAGGSAVTPGLNYMFFYNQRTGYLKFFYYNSLTNNSNGGTWHLFFTEPQRWLNATGDIALPLNYGDYTAWEGLNPVSENQNGFVRGWNCMQLQLAYQSEQSTNMKLQVLPYNNNISDLQASIELEGVSKGVITSSTTTNSATKAVNSLANIAGKSAETWFNNHILPDSKISGTSRGIVASLVAAGATKLLNLFTGGFNSTQTHTSDIDLKSTFKGTVSGTISTVQSSNISPITLSVSKSHIGTELGAWNLKTSPTVYIHPVGVLDPSSEYYDAMYYKFRSSGKYKYDIEFNPSLKDHIKSYKVEILPVRYSLNDQITNPVTSTSFNHGSLGTSSSGNMETGNFGLVEQSDLLYGSYKQKGSLYDDLYRSKNYFEGIKRHYGMDVNDPAPKFVYLPDVMNFIRGGAVKFQNVQHPVRVVVTMVTDFEGKEETTVSSRTYIPMIEWDPELLARYNKGNPNNLNEYLKIALSSDPILQSQINQ